MSETDRIQRRYTERDASDTLSGFWTLTNPVVLHLAQERERVAIASLLEHPDVHLPGSRILDIGCGAGAEFGNYLRWGACTKNLVGVDLMLPRLRTARDRYSVNLVRASGSALPFPDASFDIVSQNVVFSSIVESEMRMKVAAEMLRVLRPGGLVLWYEAFRMRGSDPHFRSVPRAEVESLFPGVPFTFRRLTTDLGLLRRIHRVSGARGMALFDLFGAFKTHMFAVGVKP